MAVGANAAGVILGDPVKVAACSVLSKFSLCSDIMELEAEVNNLLQQQTVFQRTLERVQTRNNENFLPWGNKYKKHMKI